MSEAVRVPGARWRPWQPDRHENVVDPLPGIIAVRYAEALSTAEDHYRLGRPDEALKQLALAGTLARHRALPHVLEAEIHAEAGRQKEAMAAYERALELEAEIRAEASRQKEAMAAYERALELQPNNDIARAGYRWALASAGSAVHPDLAPAHVTADRAAAIAERPPRPRVQLDVQTAFMFLVPYLILLAIAELAVTFLNPVLVFPLHGGMITLAAIHVAFLERNAGADPKARYLAALLLTLMLSPLIRIISLTLPLSQIDAPYRFLFAGIPMVIGAFMVARYVGFRPRWIGLVWRDAGWQVVAIEASIFLGFIEYAILRPEPLAALPWTAAGWLPALAVTISTGFPEELIFRGMMQTAARPLIGSRWSVIYVSLVFAVLHIGYRSVTDFAFVLAVGLLYGWLFERSRSIIGISIGHGVANVILFFVAANLFAG